MIWKRNLPAVGIALVMAALLPRPVSSAPAVPPQIPIEIFAQLPTTSQMRISPDGRRLAWLQAHEGRRRLLIATLEPKGKGTIAIPPPDDMDMVWIEWANNDYLLMSMGFDARRREFFDRTTERRLMSVAADGSGITNMVIPKKQKSRGSRLNEAKAYAQIQDNVIDMLPDDRDHFLLVVNDDQNFSTGFAVRRVDVRTGRYKTIGQTRWITDWATDRAHELRLKWGYELSGDDETPIMSYRRPDSDQWVNVTGTPIENRYGFLDFFEDPRFAYVSAFSESDHKGIYKYDMYEQKIVEPVFVDAEYDIDSPLVHPLTGTLAGVSYIADKEVAVWFDPDLAHLQAIFDKVLAGFENHIVSISRNFDRVIVLSKSDTDPGVYYLFDRTAKRLSEIAQVYRGLDPKVMAPVRSVSYTARDGLKIEAYLTLPVGREAKGLPAVILPHGGPWARDYKTFDYLAQFMANRGYAVLQPNFRGSTGYGSAFRRAGNRQWGRAMQDDVTDATKWLIDQGIADPARICIVGGSYGGYAALMGAVKTPDLFACAASINGVTDLPLLISADSRKVGLSEWIEMIGEPGEDSDILRENSPRRRAPDIRIPVLLAQARDDTRVEVDHARRMKRALERAGKDFEYLEFKRGGHTLEAEESRLTLLRTLEKFLARNIGVAPAKKSVAAN